MRKLIAACLIAVTLAGCNLTSLKPQEGGGATVNTAPATASIGQNTAIGGPFAGMPNATLAQPQNPNSTSAQNVDYEYEEVVEYPYDTVKETTTTYPDGRSVSVKEPVPAGTKVIKRSKSKVIQEIGGSWKDTARELGAALSSFQGVQYVGIGVLLLGAIGFFHPVLRALIGGKDTAMAIMGCGAVMMFGPFLFVQYSRYFFLAIILAGAYWLFARFKYKEGKLDALESKQ